MADRRKLKKKKGQDEDEDSKPAKLEYTIAKYLRKKLPEKKATLSGHKVEYFVASKAVDCLIESEWASSKKECIFTNRRSVIEYLDMMLSHKFFHRARKIVVEKDLKKKKDTKDEEESVNEDHNKEEKIKDKKKFKLDMHYEQLFLDGNEAFVWIYNPITFTDWAKGTLFVIAAVLICLYPLWPKQMHYYTYYLSVALSGFLVFIIGLVILRHLIFVLVWLCSLGKCSLWILPNLTEDVGFWQSFLPIYDLKFKDSKNIENKKKKNTSNESSSNGDINSLKEEKVIDVNQGSEQDIKNDLNASKESNDSSKELSQNDIKKL